MMYVKSLRCTASTSPGPQHGVATSPSPIDASRRLRTMGGGRWEDHGEISEIKPLQRGKFMKIHGNSLQMEVSI